MSNFKHTLSIQSGYVLVDHPVSDDSPPPNVDGGSSWWSLAEVSALCEKVGCRKVLILGMRTSVQPSTLELFNLGERITEMGLQVAVVELRDAPNADLRFLETVTVNRGCPMRFFANERDAKDWLGVD